MAEYDCLKCKMWKGCPGKEWYHYGEVRWCIHQVVWLLQHKEILQSGKWPQDPYSSSDSNLSQHSVKTEASFVKPELVIAELEARLKRVGPQAELLITQIEDGRTLTNLSPGARAILIYVSGFRRKDMSYNQWQRQKRYRDKTRQKRSQSAT